jgi:hypothetical protein
MEGQDAPGLLIATAMTAGSPGPFLDTPATIPTAGVIRFINAQ